MLKSVVWLCISTFGHGVPAMADDTKVQKQLLAYLFQYTDELDAIDKKFWYREVLEYRDSEERTGTDEFVKTQAELLETFKASDVDAYLMYLETEKLSSIWGQHHDLNIGAEQLDRHWEALQYLKYESPAYQAYVQGLEKANQAYQDAMMRDAPRDEALRMDKVELEGMARDMYIKSIMMLIDAP